ncbi:MAG: outer membrane lipid asymmetry maintenance protein MlaD [Acetobacteraceae bacterium]|jgi:phospholipid/cholesterol/gamma-HCH transport system substrate-binding protein
MARRGIAETLTGAAVLLVAAGFLAYAVAHSGRSSTTGYALHAKFDHVDGLNDGADVRIAGVKVGSVENMQIDPKSFLADVTLTVRDDIHLPKDTAAEITSESLLGGKYLNLSPGGDSAVIPAGGSITITQSSISLEQLLGKFIFSAASLADKTRAAGATDNEQPQNGAPKGPGQGAPK